MTPAEIARLMIRGIATLPEMKPKGGNEYVEGWNEDGVEVEWHAIPDGTMYIQDASRKSRYFCMDELGRTIIEILLNPSNSMRLLVPLFDSKDICGNIRDLVAASEGGTKLTVVSRDRKLGLLVEKR